MSMRRRLSGGGDVQALRKRNWTAVGTLGVTISNTVSGLTLGAKVT